MTVTVNGLTTSQLTSNLDVVKVTGTEKDIITGSAIPVGSTINDGDLIQGNGKTVLNALVGEAAIDPTFTMSGVRTVNLFGQGSGDGRFYAQNWKDVHLITGTGGNGVIFTVSNFEFIGNLKLEAMGSEAIKLRARGSSDMVETIAMSAQEYGVDDISTFVRHNAANGDVVVRAGDGDYAEVTFTNNATAASDIVMGDMVIGDVLMVQKGEESGVGRANFYVYYSGSATGNGDGSLTMGDLVIGDITSRAIGKDANIYNYIFMGVSAAVTGGAVGGDLIIGDISVTRKGDAETVSQYIYYTGTNTDGGNIVTGNLQIGDIHVVSEGKGYVMYDLLYYTIDAAKGDTLMGNLTIGDMFYGAGAGATDGTFSFYYSGSAATGNATVGKLTIGDITLQGVDYDSNSSLALYFIIQQSAQAVNGDAITGGMSIGDISVTGGANFGLSAGSIIHYAKGKHVEMGDTTIGDITLANGASQSFLFSVTVFANNAQSGQHTGDIIGAITVGDINIHPGYNSTYAISFDFQANDGTVQSVSMGDLNFIIDDSATLTYAVEVSALQVGDVTLGDFNVDVDYAGKLALQMTFIASQSDSPLGNVGNVTMGDFNIVADEDASVASVTLAVTASGNIGRVQIGDINVQALTDASIDLDDFSIEASNGRIGRIDIGNIDMKATGDDAYNRLSMTFSADTNLAKGGITIGDVKLVAREDSDVVLGLTFTGSSGDIGDYTMGDILLKAVGIGGSVTLTNTIQMDDDTKSDMGNTTIGDLTLVGRGADINVEYTLVVSSFEHGGDVTLGDIRFILEHTGGNQNTIEVSATISMGYEGGDLYIGDVLLRAADGTAAYTDNMYVNATLEINFDYKNQFRHDVHIGDIKAVGGFANSGGKVLDNFGDLANVIAVSTQYHVGEVYVGEVYVGDIDYSKYKATATLGNSEWNGMGVVKAAQDDTTINETAQQNLIYLGAGDDTVSFDLAEEADYKDVTTLDTIFNFEHNKDIIQPNGADTVASLSHHHLSYEAFLAAAEKAVGNGSVGYYASVVGEDTYVAVDYSGNDEISFVIKVAGVTNIGANDLDL